MATLSEMVVQVLAARMAKKEMTLEEMQGEINSIKQMILGIEGGAVQPEAPEEETKPEKINFKKVFKQKEVICLICNKSFRTLKRHLTQVHNMSDKEYKTKYNIPAKQPLAAKEYSDKKRADAQKNKLGEKMQAGKNLKRYNTSS